MAVLRCSFCNRDESDVAKLIAGPNVLICDECVDVCNDIIADDRRLEEQRHEPPSAHAVAVAPQTHTPCAICGSLGGYYDVPPQVDPHVTSRTGRSFAAGAGG